MPGGGCKKSLDHYTTAAIEFFGKYKYLKIKGKRFFIPTPVLVP